MKLKALIVALCLLPMAALAQHAHSDKGKNGGQLAEAGEYHVEAIPNGTTLNVYITDHDDKSISTKGFKGLAILVVDGKTQRITLAPQGENMLVGTAASPLKAPIRGAVQVTGSDNKTAQAKF